MILVVFAAARRVADGFDAIAASLASRQPIPDLRNEQAALMAIFEQEPASAQDETDDERRVIQAQLLHINRQLGAMREAAGKLVVHPEPTVDVSNTPAKTS